MRNKELYEPATLAMMYAIIFELDKKYWKGKRNQEQILAGAYEFFDHPHNNSLLEEYYGSLDFINASWNKKDF